jgi:hypothetical protein
VKNLQPGRLYNNKTANVASLKERAEARKNVEKKALGRRNPERLFCILPWLFQQGGQFFLGEQRAWPAAAPVKQPLFISFSSVDAKPDPNKRA